MKGTASQPPRAFTLLELLVGMSILALLVVFLTAIVNAVNRSWSASEQRVEIYQNGRAILDQIARDLSPALVSPSLQTVQNITLTTQLANATPAVSPINNSDNLFWQTPGATNAYGNVAEVGYLAVKTTVSASYPVAHYQLQRFFSAPTTRYPTPYPTPAPSSRTFQIYDLAFTATTAPWLTNMSATNFQSCLATFSEGVLGLWVRFLDRNGDPVPWLKDATAYSTAFPAGSMLAQTKFNSAAAFNAATLGVPSSFQYVTLTDVTNNLPANAAHRLPSSVEVTIITLDARSLQRPGVTVPDPPASTLPANVPADINTYLTTLFGQKLTAAQVFTRTIRLRNGTD